MDMDYMNVVMQGGPIPGSSLVSDPENPAPYETPPEYTTIHAASEWIFSSLIEEDRYDNLIQSLLEGIPVMDIAQVILFKGFAEGKWDVNLMTLLIEPTAYIIMALAERAGVDFVIERGENTEEAEDQAFLGVKLAKERVENLKKFKELKMRLPFLSVESQNKLEAVQSNVGGETMLEEEQSNESLLKAPEQEGVE